MTEISPAQQKMIYEQDIRQFHENIEAIKYQAAKQIGDNEILIADRAAKIKNLMPSLPEVKESEDIKARIAALEAELAKKTEPDSPGEKRIVSLSEGHGIGE